MIRSILNVRVAEIVTRAKAFSFGDPDRIRAWVDLFVQAHRAAPGHLSLEVGTWMGGTALVLLEMLEELYHASDRPMLFTIDPYGQKPYAGGDAPATAGLYGAGDYAMAKALLAPYPHHAHVHLEARTFYESLVGKAYWHGGQKRPITSFAFVLLDGEHAATSIAWEVQSFARHLAPGGVLVVDNVDNDPLTMTELERSGLAFTIREGDLPAARDPERRQRWAWTRRP